jgi:hypothetical protein
MLNLKFIDLEENNKMLTLEIHRKSSKNGKRTLYYPTINGKRLNRTNYAQKWEAKRLLRAVVEEYGEKALEKMTG